MPDPSEIGAGMGDFIPAEKPDLTGSERGFHVYHVKVTCAWCGNKTAHVRVSVRDGSYFIGISVEPCQECLTGMVINQQIKEIEDA